jgi:hypothetical protein
MSGYEMIRPFLDIGGMASSAATWLSRRYRQQSRKFALVEADPAPAFASSSIKLFSTPGKLNEQFHPPQKGHR